MEMIQKDKFGAIIDKLLEYKSITPTQHTDSFLKMDLV